MRNVHIFTIALIVCFAVQVFAEDTDKDKTKPITDKADKTTESSDKASDLAKQSQNPVADMVSLPFQYNTYFNTGPKDKTQNVLLVQPVVPMTINDNWNFIARPIIPILEQPPFVDGQNRNYGLGNIQFQGFFSPKDKVWDDWIVGFGPYLEFPTNSGPDNRFGSDNFSAGPAFVGLKMDGPWVYGSLVSHLWSYHGNDPEVNTTTIQPFVNYNLDDGWYLNSSPLITANWSADSSDRWTIPIGGGLGKVFKLGKQPVNASLSAYYNLEAPDTGAEWQLQFQIQFLFPKKR